MYRGITNQVKEIFKEVVSGDEDHQRLVKSTIGTIGTFELIAGDGKLPLTTGDAQLERRVVRTLTAYTGRDDIRRVMFVSPDDADDENPWWMCEKAYTSTLLKSGSEDELFKLWKQSHGIYHAGQQLVGILNRFAERGNLPAAINSACGELKWQAEDWDVPSAAGKRFYDSIFRPVLDALLLATLLNRPEEAKRADEMATLLRWTLPHGERKSIPGTWMCLTKAPR